VRLENGQTQPLPRGRWKAKGETVVLEIEPVAARVVESIYRWAVEHDWGHTAIAAQLNRDGVPAPESLVRQGAVAWSKDTIRAILRNPIYRGTLTYAKAQYSNIGRKRGKVFRPEAQRVVVEGAAPAIVTDALWHAAQARRQPSRFGRGRPWHREYLLSGVIRCGRCGKHYQAKKQVRGRVEAYYVCGGYLASGTAICEALSIPVEYLDEAVLDGIQKRLEQILDREWLARRLRERLIAARAAEPEAPEIAAQLAETRRRIERLVQALAAGAEELPSVRPALVGLERERAHLEARLNAALARSQANDPGLDAVIERILAFLNDIREVLAHGEPGQRKAAVRCFLEGIRIENRTRQAVLSWYRLPRLPADSVRLVELRGFEPLTPRLPASCSPN
jgi:site-specific DNA recombinase